MHDTANSTTERVRDSGNRMILQSWGRRRDHDAAARSPLVALVIAGGGLLAIASAASGCNPRLEGSPGDGSGAPGDGGGAPVDCIDEATVGPEDVMGTFSSRSGAPVIGMRVLIAGTATGSDACGRFVVRGVSAPYDLGVVWPGTQRTYAHLAVGIETRRPTLRVGAYPIPPTYLADVRIDAPARTAVDQRYMTFASDGSTTDFFLFQGEQKEVPPQIPVLLGAAQSAPRDVALLSFTEDPMLPGVPSHYVGFARATLQLTGATSGPPLYSPPVPATPWAPVLEPVSETTVTGDVKPAPGQTLYEAYSYLRLDPASEFGRVFTNGVINRAPFSATLPRIPGTTPAVYFSAYDDGKPGSAGGAQSDALVPLSAEGKLPPVQLRPSPAISVTGSLHPGTQIAWTGGDATCVVEIVEPPDGPRLSIAVRGSSALVPDLSAIGHRFPKLTSHLVSVRCFTHLDGTFDEASQLAEYVDDGYPLREGLYTRAIPVRVATD